jgi:hypothetical protein
LTFLGSVLYYLYQQERKGLPMKMQVGKGSQWKFSSDPFDAFRIKLWYGRNKHDTQFLATKVAPDDNGILPEGLFKVIKTREKGTILVVPGEDATGRILFFQTDKGGFRGYVRIEEEFSTATILKRASAASACESGLGTVAVFQMGEELHVEIEGRYAHIMKVYRHNGTEIVSTEYEYSEYVHVFPPPLQEGDVI